MFLPIFTELQKFQKNQIKNQSTGSFRNHRRRARGGPPSLPGGQVAQPTSWLHHHDTSQTYLLFQTLLLLFCPHSCMIWTELTRTNAVFSRAVCMVILCAGKWIFLTSQKIP